jgi:PAS domain S-box-containing protein
VNGPKADRSSDAPGTRDAAAAPTLGSPDRPWSVFDPMLEGVAVIGRDWRYLYANATAARHAQHEPATMIGRTVPEIWPGIDGTDLMAALRRCMDERVAERFETSFTYPDGWTGWYDYSVEPIPQGIFVLSLAITRRKQAESEAGRLLEQLRQHEESFTAALDASIETIAVLRPVLDDGGRFVDAEILFANRPGRERWLGGLDLAAVRGRTLREGWPYVADLIFPIWGPVVETGVPFRGLVDFVEDGQRHTFDQAISAFEGGFVHVGREVTDQVEAAAALRESEERFRAIVEGIDAIVGYRPKADGQEFVSPQAERILGYGPDQLASPRFWASLVHPDDRAAAEATWAGKATEWVLQYRMRRADGAWVWVDDRARRTFTPDGRSDARYGVITDITERMQAEDERAAAEARLRLFVDANVIGVLVSDEAGHVIDANDYYLAVIGCTRGELEQGSIDWNEFTPLEGRAADKRAVADVRERGRTALREKVYRRRDGTIVPVLIVTMAVPGSDGQITSFVLDISERERAAEALRLTEERFSAAVDRLLDPLLVMHAIRDDAGSIIDFQVDYANDAAGAEYELPRAEVIGRRLLEFEPEAVESGLMALYVSTVTTGEPLVLDSLHQPVVRAGQALEGVFEIRASRFGDGLVVTWREVTERQRLLDALVRTERLDAISRLAASAAHDFGNVMMGIRIFEQFLEQSIPVGDPRREDVAEIGKAVRKGTEITQQLLAFGRDRAAVAAGAVEVSELLEELAPVLARVAGNTLTLEVETGGADRARISRENLEQVLLHLVSNARDATPAGGRLRISTGVEVLGDDPALGIAAGTYLYVDVADTGTGMTPGVLKRAFEPFFSTKPHGSGIGLSGVYGIAREAGGGVRIESEPGRGTIVRVLLPHVRPAPRPEVSARWPHRGRKTPKGNE